LHLGNYFFVVSFWVLIGDRSIGEIRRERRLEPEFDSSFLSSWHIRIVSTPTD
jgi:hypothetical protein